jgi:Xaa-Pro dipeptidase
VVTSYEVFPEQELNQRLAAVRRRMKEQDLDALVVSVPENIYYLTGLDHWGFFACHVLVVPAEGRMALACRAMERITVENQVGNPRNYLTMY